MYRINKTEYGIELTLVGFIEEEEMVRISREAEILLAGRDRGFCVLADMCMIKSLPIESRKVMLEMQKRMIHSGMSRSVLVHDNHIVHLQFKKLSRESGVGDRVLHLNANKSSNWREEAMGWIVDGKRNEQNS